MHKKYCLLALLLSLGISVIGQKVWTLREAVDYALENNLTVQQSENQAFQQTNILIQARQQRLPSLSGSANGGISFGLNVDPVTNVAVDQRFVNSSYNLNAGITVFSGGFINNTIKQSKLDERLAIKNIEVSRNDISLQVATAYLGILLAREQLVNAEARLELSEEQLAQTDKLIRAGSLPEVDRYDLVAQIATDQQTIVELENSVNTNTLTLKQLLQLPVADSFEVDRPEIELEESVLETDFDPVAVYNQALASQPEVEASRLQVESARIGEQIAKSSHFPTVSLFGGLNTSFSRLLDEELLPPGLEQPGFEEQIRNNFGQSIGVSINIPIYNRGQITLGVQRAELVTKNADIQREQTIQLLANDVQAAVQSFRAAREAYRAAVRSLEAAEAAFNAAQRQYDLGAINTLNYVTSANRLDIARTDVTRNKYQLIFNLKVVEFYLGRPLELD